MGGAFRLQPRLVALAEGIETGERASALEASVLSNFAEGLDQEHRASPSKASAQAWEGLRWIARNVLSSSPRGLRTKSIAPGPSEAASAQAREGLRRISRSFFSSSPRGLRQGIAARLYLASEPAWAGLARKPQRGLIRLAEGLDQPAHRVAALRGLRGRAGRA